MAAALDFFPLAFLVGSAPAAGAASTSISSSSSSLGKTGGHPYVEISRLSLLAEAWMGMPVQWNAWGKSTLRLHRRWYADANSSFEREKACPMWRRPFMYG